MAAIGKILTLSFLLSGCAAWALASTGENESCPHPTAGDPFRIALGQVLTEFSENFALLPDAGPRERTAAIYGKDSRVLMTSSKYPWRAIGELSTDISCTASLISSCHILTAAHCVASRSGDAKDVTAMKFQGSNGGPSAGVESLVFGRRDRNPASDWAVLKLGANLGDQLGWLGLKNKRGDAIDLKKKFILAGYNTDMGNEGRQASVDPRLQVRSHDAVLPNLIFHNANAAVGSSGGPIFEIEGAERAWVVAVNTMAVVGEGKKQIFYETEPADPSKLGVAVASAQFYEQVVKFIAEHPCQ